MANILLITHWTGGDVLPFIRLGTILKRVGHKITIFTHCYYRDLALRGNLEFVAIDTPELFEEMNKDIILLADPINNTKGTLEFNKKYHGEQRLLFEYKLISEHCNENTLIIARHRSSVSGLLVAEKLKIPVASVFLAPNYLDHMVLHNQVFGKEILQEINEARRKLELEDIWDWKKWLYSPKRYFAFWPRWYAESDEDWPLNVINIGFVLGNNPEETFDLEITEFLQKNEQVVLITGGSSNMVKQEFYQVAAKSCEMEDFPALLVTSHDELVPKHLPESIKRVRQAPLRALMKKTIAIIHHGGMGTLSEAIDAGIPQIILPHLTDGPDNAQRLARLGIAKVFPKAKWDYIQISKALRETLSVDFKKRCQFYCMQQVEDRKDVSWIRSFEEMVNNERFLIDGYVKKDIEPVKNHKIKELNSLTKQQLLDIIQRKLAEEKSD